MKTLLTLTLLILCVSFAHAQEQQVTKIPVSFYRSSYIYFNDDVSKVDLGLKDSYDAHAEGNFVRVTALADNTDYKTNLTVFTKNGIYAFLLYYQKDPQKLYWFPNDFKAVKTFGKDEPHATANAAPTSQNKDMAGKYAKVCKDLAHRSTSYPVAAKTVGKIYFSLFPVNVYDDKLFFKCLIQNNSNIDYDVDFFKFHIKNKHRIKRSSTQEIYFDPIFVFNKDYTIPANTSRVYVFVLNKFTILDDKNFFIEIKESSGERSMAVKVNSNAVLNAVQYEYAEN